MKTNLWKTSLLLVAGIAIAATAAEAARYRPAQQVQLVPGMQFIVPVTSLSCVVAGTPVEFPDDIMITNTGNTTLAAGSKINWYLHANAYGVHTLAQPLAPTQYVLLANVSGGWPAGASCTASKQ